MRIEAITRRKIVVELSPEDMNTLDITYEALDYASLETRRVIWVILDRVRESTGCDIDPSGQLLIDAMPRPTGGCILFFTLHSACAEPFDVCSARVLRKQEQLLAVFEFSDLDALLDCAFAYNRGLNNKDAQLFTSVQLFRRHTRYRLLLCPALELTTVRRFFCEYARYSGDDIFAAQHTLEHWKPVRLPQGFISLSPACPALAPCRITAFNPGSVYTKA